MMSPFLSTEYRTGIRYASGISSYSQIVHKFLSWFRRPWPPFFKHSDIISSFLGDFSFFSMYNPIYTTSFDDFFSNCSMVVYIHVFLCLHVRCTLIFLLIWFNSFLNIPVEYKIYSLW